jgi:3',5'-cyclic AMP phosphodiesterase CpdA
MRIVQLSDVHVWRYPMNPFRLVGKRAVGVLELLRGRAKRFRLERLAGVVERAARLDADHYLITGDLTTTALSAEFRDAVAALRPILADPSRATVIPGNHDRYTSGSVRGRKFERFFGRYSPGTPYPWLRPLDDQTAILGLDPTRAHISARGRLPEAQLGAARGLAADRPRRLIVACHYPLAAPPEYERQLAMKRLKNAAEVADWARTIGPHVFCCGHVHAAWAFTPPGLPNQLCLNSGAPLLRDPTGFHMPGFLEITLDGDGVRADHHAWDEHEGEWIVVPMRESPGFFASASEGSLVASP